MSRLKEKIRVLKMRTDCLDECQYFRGSCDGMMKRWICDAHFDGLWTWTLLWLTYGRRKLLQFKNVSYVLISELNGFNFTFNPFIDCYFVERLTKEYHASKLRVIRSYFRFYQYYYDEAQGAIIFELI